MSPLHAHVDRYLAVRRAVGYELKDHERMLAGFADHLETVGAHTVTTTEALAWANTGASANHVARRLTVVRGFARYLHGVDGEAEVPAVGLGPRQNGRRPTHLYTPAETGALLQAARALRPEMWAASLSTLIGLLAATGLRPGEAYRLDQSHVDLDAGRLTIVETKRGRSRQIPLHASTVAALADYQHQRDRVVTAHSSVFVTRTGAPLDSSTATNAFRRLRDATSIPQAPGERPARLYTSGTASR